MQPWVKSMVTPQMAELMRKWHPLRLQYEAFSSQNPVHEGGGERGRQGARGAQAGRPRTIRSSHSRKDIEADRQFARSMARSQEALSEAMFLAVYGSPALQAAVGVDPQSEPSRRREMDPKHRELLQARIAELKSKIGSGGLREAAIRALLYVGSARGMVDERSLEACGGFGRPTKRSRITLAEFKMLVREQFFMLLLDREAALAAIPKLLPDNMDERRRAFGGHSGSAVGERGDIGRGGKATEAGSRLFGLDDRDNTVPFDPKAESVIDRIERSE